MVEPKFNEQGLVVAIAQDYKTGEILMQAFMNREAWEKTLREGKACYWSRSRRKLWVKGESSGNVQEVKEIFLDCDNDSVLLKINQVGDAACHTGYRSCFYKKVDSEGNVSEIGKKVFDPEEVYGGKK